MNNKLVTSVSKETLEKKNPLLVIAVSHRKG